MNNHGFKRLAVVAIFALIVGAMLIAPYGSPNARDRGFNQPGAAGNTGRDPGINQPGAAGNKGRDPASISPDPLEMKGETPASISPDPLEMKDGTPASTSPVQRVTGEVFAADGSRGRSQPSIVSETNVAEEILICGFNHG